MTRPAVSVVMPNYNHGKFLVGALEAIFNQSVAPHEVIVLDDKSTDDSLAVLERYRKNRPSLRVIAKAQNAGVVSGMNELLALASGDFILFTAADDLILPEFLERYVETLSRHPDAGICSCASNIIDETGAFQGMLASKTFKPAQPVFASPDECRRLLMKHGSWIFGNTAVYRRSALEAIGGFRSNLGPYADGFAHEVLALTFGACYIPQALAAWRRMPTTYSALAGGDASTQVRIREFALTLMQTEFATLFSDAYTRRWRGRLQFATVRHGANKLVADARLWFGSVLDARWSGDRLIRRATFAAAQLAAKLFVLFAGVVYRPYDAIRLGLARVGVVER